MNIDETETKKLWEEHRKKMGDPFDLRYTVIGTEGPVCPMGYGKGDHIEYCHGDKSLEGSKGICLVNMARIIESMWRIRGPEPHSTGSYVTSKGERYARVMCECGGADGPKLWWEGRKIPREDMDGFYMSEKQLKNLGKEKVYEVEARLIRQRGRGEIQEIPMCEGGWQVGDWIRYDPATQKMTTSRSDNGMCLYMLQKISLYIGAMTYVPSWAEIDEKGEPYLIYRCDTWTDTVWKIRRIGEEKDGGRMARPFMTKELDETWEKGRSKLIEELNQDDYRYKS
mgnify:CR=1 FL=1